MIPRVFPPATLGLSLLGWVNGWLMNPVTLWPAWEVTLPSSSVAPNPQWMCDGRCGVEGCIQAEAEVPDAHLHMDDLDLHFLSQRFTLIRGMGSCATA